MPPKNKSTRTCPTCGAKLAKGQRVCPNCGAEHSKSAKKRGGGKSKSTKTAKVKCESCGSLVSKKLKNCPSCGNALKPEPEEPVAQHVEEVSVAPEPERVEPQEVEAEKKTAEERPEEEPVEVPVKEEIRPAEGLPPSVAALATEDTKPCPLCSSMIPASFQRCPVCNADLAGEPPEPMAPTPAQEPVQPKTAKEAPKGIEAPQPPRTRTVRKRKLKSAGTGAVPGRIPPAPVGRTNGVSYGRGQGRPGSAGLVNGTGAVNGNSFVNGTGAPSGPAKRSKTDVSKRSRIIRWQILALLLAIVIIIPTFVFISYSHHATGMVIDGDFDDWKDATTYGTRIFSTAPTSNITEWAVATESSDLFLYLKTEASMMSSSDLVSYYLFVDSDGATETGYIMESIGADYMLQISGWDSEVKATSLSWYNSLLDQYDWSSWLGIDTLSCSLDGQRLEARARMPEIVGDSARFVMISKDPVDRSSVSYPAPIEGGVLIVHQETPTDIVSTGIVSKAGSTIMLKLSFSCQGQGGKVTEVNPSLKGVTLAIPVQGFPLEVGQKHDVLVAVNTSAAADGTLVSAEIIASGIVSDFASVEVLGSGAKAYAGTAPSGIAIDGAFADWTGLLSTDYDPILVDNSNVDLHQVGVSNSSLASYFYVSVSGEMCAGTYIPAKIVKPSGTSGGGAVVHSRRTAEDVLNIYVDTDRSDATGYVVELAPARIGAERKIEVSGLFGVITNMTEYNYSSSTGKWEESMYEVKAGKDDKRIEIGVSAASLGGSTGIDFIVETSTWEGRRDLATFDPSSVSALTRTWVVDPATASSAATALSCQRKMFFDGTNYWSFYFDGTNTVHKYSTDGGITWSTPMKTFTTAGVNKVSVWYDPATDIVYAVGDDNAPTTAVTIQRGVVDPANHKIAWNPSDEHLNVSKNGEGDKNTFISKDAAGYIWILAANNTGIVPIREDLSVFKSSAVDNLKGWTWTGNLLGGGNNQPTCKGSILPAGTGSDMFAIYTYAGNVASRKYTTNWTTENIIYAVGDNALNTENSPPSAVVDSKGVVHVVYGTGRKSGPASAPTIEYSHNITNSTTFTPGLDLDPTIAGKVGDFYPTISVDTSTDNLSVLWLQSDNTLTPRTVIGRACISGTWSTMTIEGQTTFAKQYLTSIYYLPHGTALCWQWTQNTTAPIQVMFDSTMVPEFSELAPLVFASALMVIVIYGRRSRRRDEP